MSEVQATAGPVGRKWRLALAAALFVGIAAAGVRTYLTATDASPGLRVKDEPGRLLFTWDGESAAVRRAGYGVLEISEGSEVLRLHLDKQRLREGRLSYRRASDHVTAQLSLPRGWGPAAEETVVFVGSLPAAQEEGPEAGALRQALRERDALAAEVERLSRELEDQRARAAQLQEVNRLLRQRLEIEAARPR